MPSSGASPALWVQLTQALVARELVDTFGLPARRAAELLGLAPSAISQYLSGKRLRGPLAHASTHEEVRSVARLVAQRLVSAEHPGDIAPVLLLEAARDLSSAGRPRLPAPPALTGGEYPGRPTNPEFARFLRARIMLEQTAVADCMRLAQKSRDELTRAIFRQIASDSLRHAEIVASIASYLDRGLHRTVATGVTRADIERLIAKEHEAESRTGPGVSTELGGVLAVLWESMESDERKHEVLLAHLLETGLPPPERSSPAKRAPRRG
ncbi:MAG: hypothetical protein HKL79_06720 [Thermoplasmata archaeon]|nr:hypothetical protein [Thermoplasmata archaeon]